MNNKTPVQLPNGTKRKGSSMCGSWCAKRMLMETKSLKQKQTLIGEVSNLILCRCSESPTKIRLGIQLRDTSIMRDSLFFFSQHATPRCSGGEDGACRKFAEVNKNKHARKNSVGLEEKGKKDIAQTETRTQITHFQMPLLPPIQSAPNGAGC